MGIEDADRKGNLLYQHEVSDLVIKDREKAINLAIMQRNGGSVAL